MKRFCIAAITCLALAVGVSPATADSGLGGVPQEPTGTSQEDTNAAGDASASNANGTWQSNEQGQAGYGGDASSGDATTGGTGCCGSGGDATSGDAYGGDVTQSQEATNSNSTTQEASAESKAEQAFPVNVNVGESGAGEQSNTNHSGDASAWNKNYTDQSNEQAQKGVGGDATTGDATTGGSSGDASSGKAVGGDVDQTQDASNSNNTSQTATAESKAIQIAPVNVNVPVCVAKYCESGDVEQSNTNRSGDASASNANGTWQSNEQGQAGYGGDASSGDATTGGKGCCGSGGDATSGDAYGGDVTQSQEATNSNNTSQSATAESKAIQIAPVNVYAPVCVAKHCRFGDVEQSNTNRSGDASAWNKNYTGQSNEQFQKGVGGDASSGDATSGGSCCKPNWHPKPKTKAEHGGDASSGKAVGGDVDQTQYASNSNNTSQTATAESKAIQIAPANVYAPVCIAKHCRFGDVEQSNTNRSGDASASNANGTWQSNEQGQAGYGGDASSGDATTGGKGCCGSGGDATSGDAYGGDVTQSQEATNSNSTTQEASAESKAEQAHPVNVALGAGEQSNTNRSGDASAWNKNHTGQSNEQFQKGVGGDASSGDATAGGGCCKPDGHYKPKPKRDCGSPKSHGKSSKSYYGKPCHESKPKPYEREHGGDASSGKAVGGDVDQSQVASNDNSSTQTAAATSTARQKKALNLAIGLTPWTH